MSSRNEDGRSISRRSVIAGSLIVGAALAGATGTTAEGEHDHMHHDLGPRHKALIDGALRCVGTGAICQEHCMTLLGTGDTSLKDCIRSVATMMPMCEALAKLGALDAPRLKELARVCIDVCDDCEKECRKHEDHHASCRACADSCSACVKECKTLLG